MSKKITFDNLPEAVAELIEKVENIVNLLESYKPKKRKEIISKIRIRRIDSEKMNLQETASFLNISTASLYSYVKNKKIPFEKENRRLVFSKSELNKWKQDPLTAIDNNKTITVKEAQTLLNKPLASIYYLIKSRKLKVIEKRGRILYYSKKDLIQASKKNINKV